MWKLVAIATDHFGLVVTTIAVYFIAKVFLALLTFGLLLYFMTK
jgi:hypothetical protein